MIDWVNCGCYYHSMFTQKYKPVEVGAIYGRWTVLRPDVKKHRHQHWLCQCSCGTISVVDGVSLKSGNSTSCGCRKSEVSRAQPKRSASRLWRGGRHIKGGYVVIYAPEHPAATSRKYVAEHRLVMEAHIGRLLMKEEFVHHINGIKTDNRLENLELWSRHHPQGQRVEDLLVWADYIRETYGHLYKDKKCKKQYSSPNAAKSKSSTTT